MQWLNIKPEGQAQSELHKGRPEVLAMQNSCEKTKQNKASDLYKTQWTLQGFTGPLFLNLRFNLVMSSRMKTLKIDKNWVRANREEVEAL